MQKTILIYGIHPLQRLQLESLGEKAGIRCKFVTDGMVGYTIGQLLSQKELPEREGFPLGGKFALLDGFCGNEHEAAALINQVSPGVIKAVHTVHNDGWRFSDLCGEILEEHRTMNQRNRS